jgi:hypothetical protein
MVWASILLGATVLFYVTYGVLHLLGLTDHLKEF